MRSIDFHFPVRRPSRLAPGTAAPRARGRALCSVLAMALVGGCLGGQSGTPHPSRAPQCEEVAREEVMDTSSPAPGHVRPAADAIAELTGSWSGSCGEMEVAVSASYANAKVETVSYRWEDHGKEHVEPRPCHPTYETRLRLTLRARPELDESTETAATLTRPDGAKESRWSVLIPLKAVEGTLRPRDSYPDDAETELFAGASLAADSRMQGRLMWFGEAEHEDGKAQAFQEPICDLMLSREE